MGVLTHLDQFKDETELTKTIEHLQDHFQTEICEGATIFHLSCLNDYELYKMLEVQKLAEAISMLRFRTPSWRAEHPYVLVDRFEDVTPPEKLHKDANCKRIIGLCGHLRGCNIKSGSKVHLAGVGDFRLDGVRSTADPSPLSSEMEKENDFFEPPHMKKKRFRTGTYIRLEVHDVPFSIVENFDPCHPILVGGINHEEDNVGCMQARLKRHDWHMKLLKSEDPTTVSAGWRRYQTIPIYAMELDTKQHESAKYIPQYEHCLAMFWGPLAPPHTRIAVVQGNKEVFRIRATAVVLDPKHHSKIVKESKLKGKPHKIRGRRAPIKFTPDTDVDKVIGASIRTWTEIRGKVDEATKKEGIAKCTFKSKIDFHDTVIMPVFRQVEAPRVHYPLAALEPHDYIVPVNKDSLKQGDPAAHRQLRLAQQRRSVKFPDADPCSYSFLKYLMLSYMTKNVRRKTVVVMSEEKRGALTMKRKREERKKERRWRRLDTRLLFNF
ncbi:ribosome biogenesis protein BMS1-like [Papaver somniferum]|uniref:ribosome biogenesis protein BMS1-like n=1 Tax=Papaver somniferum TaxID=3469 RepID=UPI000E6FFC96|nr:ribosome biogenesis protein BMS1-like [Papaver somniferum]